MKAATDRAAGILLARGYSAFLQFIAINKAQHEQRLTKGAKR